MQEKLRQLVASDKPIKDYTTQELIDCLFEPVGVYVEECDADKHLYRRKEERERNMAQKFYRFRWDVKAELKRRDSDG